jgi:hypothetical protein
MGKPRWPRTQNAWPARRGPWIGALPIWARRALHHGRRPCARMERPRWTQQALADIARTRGGVVRATGAGLGHAGNTIATNWAWLSSCRGCLQRTEHTVGARATTAAIGQTGDVAVAASWARAGDAAAVAVRSKVALGAGVSTALDAGDVESRPN